jgi:hypothetical protein
MSKVFLFASLSVLVAIGLMLTGCSDQKPSAPQGEPAADDHDHEQEHGDHDHEHGDHKHGDDGDHQHDETGDAEHSDHAEHDEQLSQLSADDRALAEKQKVCPVSDQPLGSMGKPFKVTVNGQDVFLCCQGCEGEIKRNPEKYLAKLPE